MISVLIGLLMINTVVTVLIGWRYHNALQTHQRQLEALAKHKATNWVRGYHRGALVYRGPDRRQRVEFVPTDEPYRWAYLDEEATTETEWNLTPPPPEDPRGLKDGCVLRPPKLPPQKTKQ